MKIQKVTKKLERELVKRGLHLVWGPELNRLRSDDLIVFGAEQPLGKKEPLLTAGFGPTGSGEQYGNSPDATIQEYNNRFLEALEAAGIPRSSLHSNYPHVGRGKIWPTFVARLTQKAFEEL